MLEFVKRSPRSHYVRELASEEIMDLSQDGLCSERISNNKKF
jgi:hypothetical protein